MTGRLPCRKVRTVSFYGGVNTSLIITDMFEDLKSDYLNFLKVRAAWGQTGNDAPILTRTSSLFYIRLKSV